MHETENTLFITRVHSTIEMQRISGLAQCSYGYFEKGCYKFNYNWTSSLSGLSGHRTRTFTGHTCKS